MTAIPMHAAPRWRDIAIEQVRSVGLHVRAVGGLLIGSLAIYAAVAIRVTVNAHNAQVAHKLHGAAVFDYTPAVSILIAYLALLLPAIIWHDESPTRRTYHLAMPVARSTHALTKAFAGWVWLMLGTVVFVLCIVTVDIYTRHIAGATTGFATHVAAWEWLVPFTAVTVAYLISSGAAIGAQTPAVWIVGPPALYAGTALAVGLLGHPETAKSMLKVFSGYYGAAAAIGGWVDGIDAMGNTVGGPSAERWLGATLLWGAAAAILLIVVARRRRDLT